MKAKPSTNVFFIFPEESTRMEYPKWCSVAMTTYWPTKKPMIAMTTQAACGISPMTKSSLHYLIVFHYTIRIGFSQEQEEGKYEQGEKLPHIYKVY